MDSRNPGNTTMIKINKSILGMLYQNYCRPIPDIEERKINYLQVLISHGYCDKLLQTWQLETTAIYSLLVLEIRTLKSVSLAEIQESAGLSSLWMLRGESLPHHCQLFVAASIPGLQLHHSHLCLCAHIAFFSSVLVKFHSASLLYRHL